MKALRALLLLLTLVLGTSMVQEGKLERIRSRWNHLPKEERVAREARLRELMELSDDERRALLERVRAMRSVEEEAIEKAPQEFRRRLREAGPRDRERLHRDRLEDYARERGRGLRDKLPPELRDFRGRRGPGRHPFPDPSPEVVAHVAKKLGLSQAQVDEIRGMEPEARRARLHRLMLESIARRRGLPPGLSKEKWAKMQALGDRAFLEAAREHFRPPPRGERGRFGRDRERGPGFGPPRGGRRPGGKGPEGKGPGPGKKRRRGADDAASGAL